MLEIVYTKVLTIILNVQNKIGWHQRIKPSTYMYLKSALDVRESWLLLLLLTESWEQVTRERTLSSVRFSLDADFCVPGLGFFSFFTVLFSLLGFGAGSVGFGNCDGSLDFFRATFIFDLSANA